MKITITLTRVLLTPENAAALARAVKLTGLPIDEIVNFLLAYELQNFNEANDDSYPENTIGLLKFKDRSSAERTLEWVKRRARKGCRGKFPLIETAIRELEDGRFEIDAFQTSRSGECERVC
jgi:hypothetical protein